MTMLSNEKFDLIIRFDENKTPLEFDENTAIEQLENELKTHNPRFYIKETEYYNYFLVELLEKDLNTNWKLNGFHTMCVDQDVPTQPEVILKSIINISNNKIDDGETFKIQCNVKGGRYIKSSQEFMQYLHSGVEKIKGEFDETSPDWLIHVEVVGENTGISVQRQR